jgi:hypothetical protein
MKYLLTFLISTLACTTFAQVDKSKNLVDFLPKGFVLLQTINGDLNKDGMEDCLLMIKATDQKHIVTDESGKPLDRNRRGIIVLFKKQGYYALASKNYSCFSSENEDGGVYFAPELTLEIKKGNLIVNYTHGRYGYWEYTFRFQNSDFELIGYDVAYKSNFVSDWVTFDEESINFSTKKKLTKQVIKTTAKGKEVFKETWKNITVNERIKLSTIKNFDDLDMSVY